MLGDAVAIGGVPCFSTDVGGSALIIGGTDVIVLSRDDSTLARRKWRARIESNFTLCSIVELYIVLYEKTKIEMREH